MSEISIPKEAEYVLTAIYKEFLDKYNSGVPRNKAKVSGHQSEILKLVPEIPEQDIVGLIDELIKQELVNGTKVSNLYYFTSLTTTGIVYMENRFSNKSQKLIKALIDFKSLFPIR